MAVKAVCQIIECLPDTGGNFGVNVSFTGIPGDPGLYGQMPVMGLSPGLLPTAIEAQVTGAVKAYLVAQGVTFGLLDTVRLLGALL